MFEGFKVKQQAAHNLKVPRQAKGKSVPLPKVRVLLHRRAALKTKSKVQRQGHSPCILHPRGPDLHRRPSAQTYVRVAGSGARRRDVLLAPHRGDIGAPAICPLRRGPLLAGFDSSLIALHITPCNVLLTSTRESSRSKLQSGG